MISKEEYIEFAENGFNIVPLIKTIEKDLDSPIKVFSRIKNKKILSCLNPLKVEKNGLSIQ